MFKYTAVIIEPRKHKALAFVLENFLENLSEEWGFLIFHGLQNKEFVQDIIDNQLTEYKHRIINLIQLEVDNLTIDQYNVICKSANFYRCIPTELFLLFQIDTIILKQNKDLINDFLEYDYVGAPWINGVVGNGGLSLRRKSKMIEVCNTVNPKYTENEDNYFCYQIDVPLNKPHFYKAQEFSVETVFYQKSFGIHAPWKHLSIYQMDYLIYIYPEIKTLIELNS